MDKSLDPTVWSFFFPNELPLLGFHDLPATRLVFAKVLIGNQSRHKDRAGHSHMPLQQDRFLSFQKEETVPKATTLMSK